MKSRALPTARSARMSSLLLVLGSTAVLMFAGLTGCARTWVEFTPYRAGAGGMPLLTYAVVAYEGDISSLAAAGAEIVGSLEVSGNGFASGDNVRGRAMEEAARHGGTHLLVAAEGSTVTWTQTTPDRATTTISGNTAHTTVYPGAQVPVTRHSGAFVIVRVPPSRWGDLPPRLQPVTGRHLAGPWPMPPRRTRVPTASGGGASTARWYCMSGPTSDLGVCYRRNDQCQYAHAEFAKHGYATCQRRGTAACFSGRNTGLSCHPTDEACQAQRDYAFSQGDDIVRECTDSQ